MLRIDKLPVESSRSDSVASAGVSCSVLRKVAVNRRGRMKDRPRERDWSSEVGIACE